MKKTNIILLVIIAVTVAVIISMAGDFSTYETFASAAQKPHQEFHVIGKLDKSREMSYDPKKDANLFSFYVTDKAGNERKVVYNGTKPTDFEKSEQIVLVGKMDDKDFHCSKILMKCPSKYKNDKQAMNSQLGEKL